MGNVFMPGDNLFQYINKYGFVGERYPAFGIVGGTPTWAAPNCLSIGAAKPQEAVGLCADPSCACGTPIAELS